MKNEEKLKQTLEFIRHSDNDLKSLKALARLYNEIDISELGELSAIKKYTTLTGFINHVWIRYSIFFSSKEVKNARNLHEKLKEKEKIKENSDIYNYKNPENVAWINRILSNEFDDVWRDL